MHLFCLFLVYALLVYFMITYKRHRRRPPQSGDDGGEALDIDLPDLDLPPGISLPIDGNDPSDYRRKEEDALHY